MLRQRRRPRLRARAPRRTGGEGSARLGRLRHAGRADRSHRPSSEDFREQHHRTTRTTTSPSRRWRCPPARPSSSSGIAPRHVDLRPFVLTGNEVPHRAGRPDPRGAARGLAGGELVAGRRHQGHLGAGGLSMLEPHRRQPLLDGPLHRARREPGAHARRHLPHVAAADATENDAATWDRRAAHRRRRAGLPRKRYGEPHRGNVLRLHGCSTTNNPSSASVRCLQAARENARAVRGALTTEMWESINDTWLELQRIDAGSLTQGNGCGEFLRLGEGRARTCSAASPTAPCCATTPSASCAWAPSSSAPTTPRASSTSSTTCCCPRTDDRRREDYYHWGALLRSVSALSKSTARSIATHHAAARRRASGPAPRHAALAARLPGSSAMACSNASPARAARRDGGLRANSMRAALRQRSRISSPNGLHEFLLDFLARAASLSEGIANDFLVPQH